MVLPQMLALFTREACDALLVRVTAVICINCVLVFLYMINEMCSLTLIEIGRHGHILLEENHPKIQNQYCAY